MKWPIDNCNGIDWPRREAFKVKSRESMAALVTKVGLILNEKLHITGSKINVNMP